MPKAVKFFNPAISLSLCFFLFTGCSQPFKKEIPEGEYGEYEIADPSGPSVTPIRTHTIEIKQMKFEPAVLRVKKGDKVVWINNDFVEHDITEENDKAWTSSKLPSGASWSMIVVKSESYYCNLHVVMKGRVVIEGAEISLLDASGITMCK
jgi:plastocyanin